MTKEQEDNCEQEQKKQLQQQQQQQSFGNLWQMDFYGFA